MKQITIQLLKKDHTIKRVKGELKTHPLDSTIKLCLHKTSRDGTWNVTDVRAGRSINAYGIEGKTRCWNNTKQYLIAKGIDKYHETLKTVPDIETVKVQHLYGTVRDEK